MANATEDFKKLVYARVQSLPEGTEISMGSDYNLTKDEILKHIEDNDEIGQKMLEIEKAFFEALKDGSIYKL
jgi:hypothetical protein